MGPSSAAAGSATATRASTQPRAAEQLSSSYKAPYKAPSSLANPGWQAGSRGRPNSLPIPVESAGWMQSMCGLPHEMQCAILKRLMAGPEREAKAVMVMALSGHDPCRLPRTDESILVHGHGEESSWRRRIRWLLDSSQQAEWSVPTLDLGGSQPVATARGAHPASPGAQALVFDPGSQQSSPSAQPPTVLDCVSTKANKIETLLSSRTITSAMEAKEALVAVGGRAINATAQRV